VHQQGHFLNTLLSERDVAANPVTKKSPVRHVDLGRHNRIFLS
jgi:hypothetical protein